MKSFKWLIPLIICIGSFMIHTNNVKALTTSGVLSDSISGNNINISNGQISATYYGDHRPYFKGYGEGYVLFSVLTSNSSTSAVDQISGIVVRNSNDVFTCDIGSNTSYIDSLEQRVLYTVKCYVNFPSGRGLDAIRIDRSDTYGILKVSFSQYITFISKDSGVDVSSIVTAINNASSDLMNYSNGFYNNWNALFPKIDNIYSSLVSIGENTDDILTAINNIKNSAIATANNTEQIKNDIKDSSIDSNNASSSASTWSNKNASNGTITNLLTLPISLLQNILNGIQTSCSNFSLGTLFDTELILPCINLSDLIGSTLFNVIDLLFSGFMILNIAKKLIKIFNDFTNLKSNQIDEIYSNGGGSN